MAKLDDHVTDTFELADYFEYLDDLRTSGATNMFGAGPYLVREYGVSKTASRAILKGWMDTFDPDKKPVERAEEALAKETAE